MLSVEFAQRSDCGRVRDHNEDYLGHVTPQDELQTRRRGWLFTVADGVGGRERGEVASRMAVENIAAGFLRSTAAEAHTALLARLVQAANSAVYEAGQGAMATTVVACALRFDRVAVAHVGDSRCYLIRGGTARQITQDHTMVNEQRKMGLITASEMATSESRHVLIRSLGPEMFVSPDTAAIALQAGDVLVLCTDGLHDEMPEAMIAQIVSQKRHIDEIASELVTRAVEIDGNDNTTAQVIRVKSVEQVGMYRGRTYRLPS